MSARDASTDKVTAGELRDLLNRVIACYGADTPIAIYNGLKWRDLRWTEIGAVKIEMASRIRKSRDDP